MSLMPHLMPLLAGISAPQAAPVEVAAETQADPAAADAGGIVVTARRREERVQDVPIALSVLSGEELTAAGAFNTNRLQQLQPSLQFYSSNPRNSAINIRGLGAPYGLTNDGIEQGVGFYVDGVYIGRVGASTFDFVDVERVEVLRGPQGTLYGKNTTAGAVNITTRAPSSVPEARLELSLGNDSFVQAKSSVSGPLAEGLALRLSTSGTYRDGTIRNVATGQDVHRLRNLGVRGQLRWNAAEGLDVALTVDFNRQNPLCCVQYYVRTGPTQRPLSRQYAALAAAFGYAPPSTDAFDRVTDLDAALNSRQEIGGAALVADWDLGPATLTSVTAWRYWDWVPANDRDFIGLPVTIASQNPSQQKQVSQEIRLASNDEGALGYTFGAFVFRQTIDTQGSQVQGSAASRWLLNPTSPSAQDPSILEGLTSTNRIAFDNDSFALFGKLDWRAFEGFRIQPGLRVNYDRKGGVYEAVVTTGSGSTDLSADQRGVLAPQRYAPRFSDWNLSGDLTLSYDVAADVHAHATYARSFKSGGINLSGLPLDAASRPILAAATVKPEKVNHWELGLKTQFLDRRATVNLAAYWTEVDDYQATVTNGQLGVIRGYLANAGKVRVRGIELDASIRPTARLSLYANGAFSDARYRRFTDAPCPPELSGGTMGATPSPRGTPGGVSPASCDISGQVLPGISKWAFSYGGEYRLPLAAGEAYLGYDGSYRSRFSSNPSPSAYTWIEGYALSNLRAGYRRDGFNAFAWMRNAFDRQYFELLSVQSGNTGLIVGQPADPRSYGITLSRSF